MRMSFTLPSGNFEFSHPETDADFEALIALNRRVHGEDLDALCRSLDRHHPGMNRSHWYAVTRPGEATVLSTLCLIPGEWRYRSGTVECVLPTAEMGLVATAEDSRGLGLSSYLVKRFMSDARSQGFPLSTIMGIPYYYHRYGYEYAVPLLVRQDLAPELIPAGAAPSVRPVCTGDMVLLERWYEEANSSLELYAQRSKERWDYLCGGARESPATAIDRFIILDANGEPAGYIGVQHDCFGPTLAVVEASIPSADDGSPGVVDFLRSAEALRREAGLPGVSLVMAESHPLQQAASVLTGKPASTYGWQVSVLDQRMFFDLLQPVLEPRLGASCRRGRPLRFELGLYGSTVIFEWDGQRLKIGSGGDSSSAGSDNGKTLGAQIPPELISPLALGFRSVDELARCRLDLSASPDARAVLDILFPRMDSFIYPAY